nr:immunoglobulin heavy chain junction region [Mus musculus]
CARDFFAFW